MLPAGTQRGNTGVTSRTSLCWLLPRYRCYINNDIYLFALSVFLAQNSQLTVAPPVILIDDPIAHVDDLNSLSFLDYLREVVLGERRQLFFATANDKLATLFERKFDFLGPEKFRRFNL